LDTSVFFLHVQALLTIAVKTRVRETQSDTKNQLPKSSALRAIRPESLSEAPRLSRRTNEHSLFLTRRPEYLHFLARIPAVRSRVMSNMFTMDFIGEILLCHFSY